jgi:hypothetical protein
MFSYYMKNEKRTIWDSWQRAADYCITSPGVYKVAILAVDIDKDTGTKECLNDHIYGKGDWTSPPGYDVGFDYNVHSCV